MINQDFLEMLCCPESKAPVIQKGDWLYSTDPQTRRRYPIRNGIPVLIVEESEVLSEEDFAEAMKQGAN